MPFDGSREDTQIGWKVPWEKAVILSLDAEDGSVRWKDSKSRHVTPMSITMNQCRWRPIFDPNSGKRIWSIYSQGEGVTPSPVFGEGLVLLLSSHSTCKGDVTESHIAWEQSGVAALASLLYIKPYLYSISRTISSTALTHPLVTSYGQGTSPCMQIVRERNISVTSWCQMDLGDTCYASMAVCKQLLYPLSTKPILYWQINGM